jgi:hypothetical protein
MEGFAVVGSGVGVLLLSTTQEAASLLLSSVELLLSTLGEAVLLSTMMETAACGSRFESSFSYEIISINKIIH